MAFIFSTVLFDIAAAVATCIVVAYLYFAHAFRYWKRRGIHYIQPTSVFGNIDGYVSQRESFGVYLKRVYDSNPGQMVVGLFAGRSPFLVACDIDVVRSVLVKDAHMFLDRPIEPAEDNDALFSRSLFFLNGKKWRHMRIQLTPTFTSGKMKNMFYLINECGKQLVPCIDQEMSKGKSVVVKDTVARYTTDVIASCAFGVNANALVDSNCEFRATTRKIIERTKSQQFISTLSFFLPWLAKLLNLRAYDESINKFIRKTFWNVVDYRKKNGIVRKDFVDIMMQMKNKVDDRVENENDLEEIKQDSKYMNVEQSRLDMLDMKLEDDDYVAQAFTFIAAGFETSSSVLSFALFELAHNPDVQHNLRQEIRAVLQKHDSEVTYDAIGEMSYLDMVVSEVMRKYPTLPTLERLCIQDYRIPGTDITIENGTSIMIPVLGIHMDPTIYPEPDKFDPERFSPENKNKRSKSSHIPFGDGPRSCIGMRFGQMQVKTALVHLLTVYNVELCAETPQLPLMFEPSSDVSAPTKDIVLAFQKIKIKS